MFVDASAIVAILAKESGAHELMERLQGVASIQLSPLTRFEAVLGLARAKSRLQDARSKHSSPYMIAQAERAVASFLAAFGAREIGIDPAIGTAAIAACKRYGAAAGHPARLNFGDCFSYACAKSAGVSLLYKGEDFRQTDLA